MTELRKFSINREVFELLMVFLPTLGSREMTTINDRLQNERKAVILTGQLFLHAKTQASTPV